MPTKSKIAIISRSIRLEESLRYNTDFTDIQTFAPDQQLNHELFDLIIADCSHHDKYIASEARLFPIPIDLGIIIKHITCVIEAKQEVRVSRKKRMLYILGRTIKLTEQEAEALHALLENSKQRAALPKKISNDPHAYEAMKSMIYRLNHKLKQNEANFTILLTASEMVLKKE